MGDAKFQNAIGIQIPLDDLKYDVMVLLSHWIQLKI